MRHDVHTLVSDLSAQLIEDRRDFHKHPEAGWTEFRTSAIIARRLETLGYEVRIGEEIIRKESMMGVPPEAVLQRCMARAVEEGADEALVARMAGGLTGVVGEMRFGDGPVLALRFDIDANDITEAEDDKHRPFREHFHSQHPEATHACGHDGHAAIGLGVAALLAGMQDALRGTVRLIFQPAEEGVRGAAPMVEAGVLDGVDCILGGHIGFLAKQLGQFICGAEKFLATTKFDVTFTGKPAHAGGSPEEGRNALLAAASAALNLHAITRHGQGASRITVGKIEAGLGRNIIPPNGLIKVETRGETSEIDAFMFANAQNVVAGAAAMYGVEHELRLMGQTKSGASSPAMAERARRIAEAMRGVDNDAITDIASMGGSEDFSQMMTVVQERGGQGTYVFVGTSLAAGHHDFYFDFDERCLATAAEFFVTMALDILGRA